MTANVVDFPSPSKPPEFLVGPFEEYRVVIEGRRIPRLTGFREGDNTCLVLDHRLSISVPNAQAYDVAYFAAQALAIGAGYANSNGESTMRAFAVPAGRLNDVETS